MTYTDITITEDETATICEALRYWAWDISCFANADRRPETNALRQLASELETRIALRSLHDGETDEE